ncbi:hypothetical protein B0H34DRAFT_254666 [Crassisporium funariophilum]|nr:hypothetical protein B0H34DRAFT_254666 [Crassisporium funariophilum]
MSTARVSESYNSSLSIVSRTRQSWNRRFSNASVTSAFSFATLASQLPEYTAVDSSEIPLEFDVSSTLLTGDSRDGTLHHPHQSEGIEGILRTPRYSYVPPHYSRILGSSSSTLFEVGEVRHFEHSFPIKGNKPWATLHTFSRESIPGTIGGFKAKPRIPRIWGSEPVAGLLELNLEDSQIIQQIKITIRGTIATGYLEGEKDIFLEHEVVIWNNAWGDRQNACANTTTTKKRSQAKLLGSYQFPFSFPFPTHVDLSSSLSAETLPSRLGSFPETPPSHPLSSPCLGSSALIAADVQPSSPSPSLSAALSSSAHPSSPPSSHMGTIPPFISEKSARSSSVLIAVSQSTFPLAAEPSLSPASIDINTITPFPLEEKVLHQENLRRTHGSAPSLPSYKRSSPPSSTPTQSLITPFPLDRQNFFQSSSLHSISRSHKPVKLPFTTSTSLPGKTGTVVLPPNVETHTQQPQGSVRGEKQRRRRSTLPQDLITRNIANGNTCAVSPTPQSFMEQGIAASIRYELTVRIVHGRFRQDSKIRTNINYIPSTVPPPALSRRQQAYKNGALLPSPLEDPDGWFALALSTVKGEFGGIGGRQVKIDCQLYLSKPLSYTRGTTIPCYLTLSSDDLGALHMLSAPKNPRIQLMRRLKYLCPPSGDGVDALQKATRIADCPGDQPFLGPGAGLLPVVARKSSQGSTMKTSMRVVGMGVWWVPPRDVNQGPCVRQLQGEIHLDRDLQPSCSCPIFSVEYFVELLPLVSSVFEPTLDSRATGDTRKNVMISYAVDVVTMLAQHGPVPVAFSEPPCGRRQATDSDD